jgi:putative membrane protein
MKKTIFYLMLSAITTIGAMACHNNDSTQVANQQNEQKFDSTDLKKDATFAVNIADANMLEIKLGELAESYATTAAVKDLGKMIVDDHTKAGEALEGIAIRNDISLPDSLSDKSTIKYNEFAAKRGTDFDKSFTQEMIDAHKNAIDAFQEEADKGNNGELKQWASETIPTLQHHLEMSDSVQRILDK